MNRREAIKRTGQLLGFVASSPVLLHLLQSCNNETPLNWSPTFFTREQAQLVSALADQILPKTDTPSASEVKVDQFIELMVSEVFQQYEQADFIAGLKEIDQKSEDRFEKFYFNLNDQSKYDLLHTIDSEINYLDVETNVKKPFFLKFKELTLLGYFTSKEIMKNHLVYDPLPMELDGCSPLMDGQKLNVGNHI